MSIGILPPTTADMKHSAILTDGEVVYARLLIETIRTQISTIIWRQVPLIKVQMQNQLVSDLPIGYINQLKALPKVGRQDILY